MNRPASCRTSSLSALPLLLVAMMLAVAMSRPAAAADQTVLGSKLQVKDPGEATKRSAVGSAKETASANTIVGNPAVSGAVLELMVNGGSSAAQSFALPQGISSSGKPFWSAVSTKGTSTRTKDRTVR
jgi:hypothetical protein